MRTDKLRYCEEDMKVQTVKAVYFSPTGTTKRVVQAIADTIAPASIELIDITKPEAREAALQTSEDELLIIGVPVYMGRVPGLLAQWFHTLQAQNTPTVCVVVYGNRAYENALLELKDVVKERGGLPIAGAAYIGEHSFSNSETPSAGRPNKEDLSHAGSFGKRIREKLQSAESLSEMAEVEVPGTYPYAGMTELWDVDFIEVSDKCTQCHTCSERCPMGAIAPHASAEIDHEKCITCCACLKACPQNARSMKPGPVKEAQARVNTLFVEPKTPEYYL